ncbi:S-layer homology domain-containing protein, partial [Paenibacillus sp. MCAF20]
GPVEVKDGAITATGKANEDGTLVVSLSPEDIAQAIKSAKSDTITIEVKSESGTEAEGTTIVIPVKELAANTGNRELAVKWGRVKVRFPAKLNEGVIGADSQAVEVAIHSVNETEIADSAKQRIKGDIVIDIDIKVDGRDVQTFGPGHPVTVEIDYTPLQGEKTHQLIVYRVMDNGELEIVKNAKYEQGVLKFQPESSGRYAAAYVDVSFTDLNQTAWARTMIESLAAREVLQGVGQDRFAPSRTVTRAEFVELLLNALQLKEKSSAESGFADVDQDEWYFDAVTTASRLGIVSGKSDGSFGAKEEITREDMAVMLFRAFQYAGLAINTSHSSGQTFSDEEKIASYAQEAVDRLFATGIIQGFEDGSFQPKASATRAQAAAVIYKLLNL